MKLAIYAFLALTLSLVGCNASTPSKPDTPLTHTEKALVKQLTQTGRELYKKDSRASFASDLVQAQMDVSLYPNFVGWITHPNNEDYTVSFYQRTRGVGQEGDNYEVFADVVFDKNMAAKLYPEPKRTLDELELAMLKARITALTANIDRCNQPYNTVVLPDEANGQLHVYLLAASTQYGVMQVGGHHKVTINIASGEITQVTPFSKSCFALNLTDSSRPKDSKLSMVVVSHIVSDYPAAIHPYLNLLHDLSIAISTKSGIWVAENGELRLMER